MAEQISVGIDIGTSKVKVVIAEEVGDGAHTAPKTIGVGTSLTRGLTRGYVSDEAEVTRSISEAVEKAEKMAGMKVKRAFISVGGVGLSSTALNGSVAITRADLEITERDIELALLAAETSLPETLTINRKIINTIPVEYKLDGKIAWGRVDGLKARKLEVKALFITCLEHHIQDLIRSAEGANIEVVDVVAAPIAASFATLTKKDRRVGCVLADIGAETLSMVVFENNTPVSLEVFPIGGADITNDIALGLKVSLEEAESIKLGSITRSTYSKKKLDEIVSARLKDCFELVESHLKKIGRNGLLPAGLILVGGASHTIGAKSIATDVLRLPVHVGEVHFASEEKAKVRDSLWATAYGLAVLGFGRGEEEHLVGARGGTLIKEGGKRWFRKLGQWVSQFLP